MKEKDIIGLPDVEGLIFDLDGVITDTATVHAKAWKEMFDAFLSQFDDQQKFSIEGDYFPYVDGIPRYDGVKGFLDSRDIDLPYGDPQDAPDKETVCGLGNRKNEIYQQKLKEGGIAVFDDAVTQIKNWRNHGKRTAVISSSKNCEQILETTGLSNLFDARVDGVVSEELGLKGKPAPDIFLKAAEKIGVKPDRAAIFEDAELGVKAGKNGRFKSVVGIERHGKSKKLIKAGADIVVSDFSNLRLNEEEFFKPLPISKLSDALERHEEILNDMGSRQPAIFLDYDGTLTPIVEHPEDAKLSDEMYNIIEMLSKLCTVAIISGRDLEDVRKMVGINTIYYAGSHGLDIAGPGHEKQIGVEALPALEKIEKEARKKSEHWEGTRIERKEFVVAIHYRQADENTSQKVLEYGRKVADANDELKVVENKKVVELRPDIPWNKGKAIDYLIDELSENRDDVLPIFIGDDVTDEDGFEFLMHRGIGIVTGDHGKPSYARYKLKDTDEVKKFLFQISDMLTRDPAHHWKVVYNHYVKDDEPTREALCTMGNGYFATRGACETTEDDGTHYPGTYLAGGYNRAKTEISGRIIENEDLVNWPNWLPLTFRVEGGEWFDIDKVELLSFQQVIDLKSGVLERRMRARDAEGRETDLVSRRFVSQAKANYAGLEWEFVAHNWSGKVEFKSKIDGAVTNNGVARYRELTGKHFDVVDQGKVGEKGIYLLAQSLQSRIYVAQAVRTSVYQKDFPPAVARVTNINPNYIEQLISLDVNRLEPVRVEKILSFQTSKDVGSTEPLIEAKKGIARAGSFKELLKAHSKNWWELWKRFDICIEGNQRDQMLLRLHIFHLLQTVSPNSIEMDMGVPARGWHGEAYRGHIFWDEIYIFPFLNLRVPEITKTLMMYRYRRLNEARVNAQNSGYKGAMFPWQSGSNGREESQELHLNPESDQWIPDHTYIQRHISADIVYNIIQYYEATHDKEFMTLYGAEIVLEVANFFATKAEWDGEKERYVINNVVGPDEYHTQYPHSEEPGINNNAYTNVMAAWVLKTACRVFEELVPTRKVEIRNSLKICEEDFLQWNEVSRKLYIPFVDERIISQFEGYQDLEDLDLDEYRKEHGEFLRIDRILQAEGDDPNRYKTSKQADVLMLFYLFSNEDLQEIFSHMGYEFDPEMLAENIAYYNKRTSHGSTLSKLVHSWVTARSKRKVSWESFEKALLSDFDDVQGGTTSEGIHLGAMAGTVDLMQRCYSGLRMSNDILYFDPRLPEDLNSLNFKIRYRSKWLEIRIDHKKLDVKVIEGWGNPAKIGFGGSVHELSPGDQKIFNLKDIG